MESNTDRFVFVDLETFGLNPKLDYILEAGIKIVDQELILIDEFDLLIWESPQYDERLVRLREMAEDDATAVYVLAMHENSGILEEAEHHGYAVDDARNELINFLEGHGVSNKDPMCGSSVQFDRLMLDHQMPQVSAMFSYRNIDVSTVKELCRRLNPRIYSLLDENVPRQEKHRVLDDITDTINELKYYRDNFLFVG